MKRSLLFAAAALSVAGPALSAPPAGDREPGEHRGHGGFRAAAAAEAAAPAPQPAPASAPHTEARPEPRAEARVEARGGGDGFAGRPRSGMGWVRADSLAAPGVPVQPAEPRPDRRALVEGQILPQPGQGPQGDRDGVPNRFDRNRNGDNRIDRGWRDRDRNGDGRVDRNWRDRDGDGVPDRIDRDRKGDRRVDRNWRDRNGDGRVDRNWRDRNGDGRPDFRDGQRFRGGWYAEGRRPFSYGGRTFYRFRADPYRWPSYQYRNYRWTRGAFLPRLFLLPDYFVTDYYAFGVEPAPYGYQWVRVGYDLLLVNEWSGEIVDVVPGVFFW